MRQDADITRLLLINGPPGAGKSTLARRYVDDHPMALRIEVDDLRVAMGGWAERDASKLQARVLALVLARAHLGAGHDVVVPQYVGRPEFVDQLEAVARDAGAEFAHVVLTADRHLVAQRFRDRRAQLLADGGAHPQADLAGDEIDAAIVDAERRLAERMSTRTAINVIGQASEDPYDQMTAALA